MASHNPTGMIPAHDPLLITLELMRTLALSVLSEHTHQASLCVTYSSTCRCERVVVATHTLAMI